jgi:hypothetical protein
MFYVISLKITEIAPNFGEGMAKPGIKAAS